MVLPTKKQWQKWSLPSKHTAIGALLGILALVFSIFAYFVPASGSNEEPREIANSVQALANIEIPITIMNGLNANAQVNPVIEFYLLKPDGPMMDQIIDSGYIRLKRPERITSINGMFPIDQYKSIETTFELPRNELMDNALSEGGYKLRIIVTDSWVNDYSERKDVLFDIGTIKEGIYMVLYKDTRS